MDYFKYVESIAQKWLKLGEKLFDFHWRFGKQYARELMDELRMIDYETIDSDTSEEEEEEGEQEQKSGD